MTVSLTQAIFWAGLAQYSVLVASALVPVQLEWRVRLRELPLLMRQLFWVYGGYVVLSIVALASVCTFHAAELAEGSPLSRAICLYGAVFWGVRLSLQPWLAAGPHLTRWWLRVGYHVLSILFLFVTSVLLVGAARWR
jgi:hypothetical protein